MRRFIGRLILKLGRWDVAPHADQPPKSIMLCYPHTSSWDFLYLKAAGWQYGLNVSWFGKRELFRGPLGVLMRALGGVPVDRDKAHNLVDSMVSLFSSRERLILCIAPEGTRHHVEHWRSGFYHIARKAHVPLQLSMLDFGRRHIEISEAIYLSGDIRTDMDKIRAFYRGVTGLHPEMTGNILLKEEA